MVSIKMTIKIDNLGFIVNEKRFFPLGFNYWPRDMAIYLWKEHDSRVIERDFEGFFFRKRLKNL